MTKNGLLTDTSYCNILLFDEKIIKVGEIHMENLTKQESFQLVNALNPFKENQLIPIGEIG